MASNQQPTPKSPSTAVEAHAETEVNPFLLVESSNEMAYAGSASDSSESTHSFKIQPRGDVANSAKALFARVFGDNDEVEILQGMDEFKTQTGCDPKVDRDGFFVYMKDKLEVEVTKAQLMDKVRRLKKRYVKRAKKSEDRVISNPHQLKLFELSKKVWAGEAAVMPGKRKASDDAKNRKKQKVAMDLVLGKEDDGAEDGLNLGENFKSDPKEFWSAYPYFKDGLEVENAKFFPKMMDELKKIGAVKAKEMDNKWREIHAKELEVKVLRLEVVKEQTNLVRDVVKP